MPTAIIKVNTTRSTRAIINLRIDCVLARVRTMRRDDVIVRMHPNESNFKWIEISFAILK